VIDIDTAQTLLDTAAAFDLPPRQIVAQWEKDHGRIFRPLSAKSLTLLAERNPVSLYDIDFMFGYGAMVRRHLTGGEFA